jgi:positive regulator of sigma E activity
VCGLEVNHETFVIRPKVGVDVSSFGSLLPIRLKKGNWLTRYFSTVWLVMTKPQSAISRVPVQEPLWVAWKFMLTTLLITVVAVFLPLVFFFVSGSNASSGSSATVVVLAFSILQFVMGFLIVALYAISWALCTHVLLQITGGSNFAIRRTVQAVLYGGAASIVGILPCLGGVASFIWWLVATTNMIARGQRVHGGRATFATLMGSLSLFIFVCGGYLLLNAVTAPLVARAQQQQIQMQQQQPELESPEEELIIE